MNRLIHRGFTLIELLVVISIIALLIAILLPALSSARDSARLVTCKSNQRQLSIAQTAYLQEHDGYFPSDPGGPIRTYNIWGGKDGTEYSGDRLINEYVQLDTEVSVDDEGAYEVFRCPSDQGMRAERWPVDRLPTMFDRFGNSYFYKSSANNNDGDLGLYEKTLDQIRTPAEMILAHDVPFYAYGFEDTSPALAASGVPFQTGYWHNKSQVGWANVVFIDGHVTYHQATYDQPDFQNGDGWTFAITNKCKTM